MISCRSIAVWVLFVAFPVGLTLLASPVSTEAATVTDTFELKAQNKEWCKGNPKFFENVKTKVTEGITLTFTRDADGLDDPFDVQAKINNAGGDFDTFTLKGLAFPRNSAGSKLEFALSGVNPGNDDHFFTVRGQATLDKLGNLTKVTGTFVGQYTGFYTVDKKTGEQSEPTECFGSGTFGTAKKLP